MIAFLTGLVANTETLFPCLSSCNIVPCYVSQCHTIGHSHLYAHVVSSVVAHVSDAGVHLP